MSLEDHLREAITAVGVQGALLTSAEGELLASVMPTAFEQARLHQMTAQLARALVALERSKRKTIELDLTFREMRLLVRTLRPGYLVLLVQRNANLPLINLSLGPVVKKIAAELKVKPAAAEPLAEAETVAPEPAAAVVPDPLHVVAPAPVMPPEAPPAPEPAPTVPAEAPVAVKELSPLLKRQITEAQLITRAAGTRGLPLRVLGGAGVALHCDGARQWMLAPTHNVLELAARTNTASVLNEILESVGFVPHVKFNESTGGKRLIYRKAESELWADIHCGAYEMYHRVEFDDVLTDEETVLPATQTFLIRLQTVEANDADLRDLIALLCDHEVSVGTSPDAIDATQITALCADDWGWYRTALRNLDRLRFLGQWARLPSHPHLKDRIEGLYQSIEHAPKSVRWQMRARVGDSVRWYKTPVFPPEAAGESAPG
jgi:predicted regulator of Ras-like GTPase activity (Roadblock/LC7/MglB family)